MILIDDGTKEYMIELYRYFSTIPADELLEHGIEYFVSAYGGYLDNDYHAAIEQYELDYVLLFHVNGMNTIIKYDYEGNVTVEETDNTNVYEPIVYTYDGERFDYQTINDIYYV
ncbi:hypothetical protein [Priestia megaterium]|uniref:hypothetical protein n=1 Tax=Priestia megaterium TaxID=1404 RepID=UPI00301E128D